MRLPTRRRGDAPLALLIRSRPLAADRPSAASKVSGKCRRARRAADARAPGFKLQPGDILEPARRTSRRRPARRLPPLARPSSGSPSRFVFLPAEGSWASRPASCGDHRLRLGLIGASPESADFVTPVATIGVRGRCRPGLGVAVWTCRIAPPPRCRLPPARPGRSGRPARRTEARGRSADADGKVGRVIVSNRRAAAPLDRRDRHARLRRGARRPSRRRCRPPRSRRRSGPHFLRSRRRHATSSSTSSPLRAI
jgi:hypothetical protein